MRRWNQEARALLTSLSTCTPYKHVNLVPALPRNNLLLMRRSHSRLIPPSSHFTLASFSQGEDVEAKDMDPGLPSHRVGLRMGPSKGELSLPNPGSHSDYHELLKLQTSHLLVCIQTLKCGEAGGWPRRDGREQRAESSCIALTHRRTLSEHCPLRCFFSRRDREENAFTFSLGSRKGGTGSL